MQGFLSGKRKPIQQKAGEPAIPVNQQRRLYAAAVVIVLCVAILLLIFENRGSALQRCEGVIMQPQRSDCLSTLAGIEKNASVCGLIGETQFHDSCIAGIAESTSNVTLCTQATALEARAGCVLNVSSYARDIKDCALVGAPYNSTCEYSIASISRFADVRDCALISNATMRSRCTYLHDFGSAAASKNASYCAALPDERNTSLLSAIFALNSSSSSQMMGFSLINATPQSYCYYRLAVETPDKGLCGLTSGMMSTLCNATFENVTPHGGMNETLCDSATSNSIKYLCEYGVLSALAISERNVSPCMQINSTLGAQYPYYCISALATKYGDASYCTYIGNSTIEQDCTISAEYAKASANTTAG